MSFRMGITAANHLHSHQGGPDLDDGQSIVESRITTCAEERALLLEALPPIPRKELAVLCLLRILDPLNFTQIFPYINELIWNLGVTDDKNKIGHYSGVVESVFAIAQLIAVYPWGVLSDTAGRRPAILAGAAGLTLTTAIFGLSQDFNSILISRCLAGLFSGNVAVIPSVLCEITNKRHEAVIYSIFGTFWPIGAILGPMIGGGLSNPTAKFPVFLNCPFLQKYPYFLPCSAIAGFNVVGFLSCYFFLDETLGRVQRSHAGTQPTVTRRYGVMSHQKVATSEAISEERYNVKHLLSKPIIRAICASACVLSFVSTAFEVVFVLFCYSPIEHGGLGFSPQEIGFALALSGTGAALLSALVMPRILVRFDHSYLYHFGMKLWTIPFLGLPLLNVIARMGLKVMNLWVGVAILLSIVRVAFIGFSINMLLVKTFAPGPAAVGATYGLVQFSICLSRALSPIFASSLYVMSHQHTIFNGNAWVIVFVGLSGIGCIFSRRIVHYARQEQASSFNISQDNAG